MERTGHGVRQTEVFEGEHAATVAELQRELDGLRVAMASRARIEQAKGMLMARHGIDEDRAFALLRSWSSLHNVKLRVVAAAVIDTCMTEPEPGAAEPQPSRLLAAALASASVVASVAGSVAASTAASSAAAVPGSVAGPAGPAAGPFPAAGADDGHACV